jgi:hypothetical protein
VKLFVSVACCSASSPGVGAGRPAQPPFHLNRLLQTLPQAQQVIHLLAGPHQPVERNVLQRLDPRLDIGLGERMLFPPIWVKLRFRSCSARMPSSSTFDSFPFRSRYTSCGRRYA